MHVLNLNGYRTMKKILFLCFFIVLVNGLQSTKLLIDGTMYRIDTMANFTAGPGTQYVKLKLTAANRLDVYFLKVDTSNPYVSFKAALGRDSIYGGERPSSLAARKSGAGAVYFAGTNADFYNVSDYIGYPLGGCVVEDEVVKVPVSDRKIIAFEDDKVPVIGVMTYNGSVKYGDQTWTIDGVNHLRETDQLILYNQYNGKTTRTNQFGTEVVVKLKSGESWAVSKAIRAEVQVIRQNKGGTAIPAGYAVLSGHGTAATKLNSLSVNDEIQISLDMEMGGRKYNVSQMVGGDYRKVLLNEGVIETGQVWSDLHPRTAIGYSADKSEVIFCVVDGRGVSAGATTKQLAYLMRSAGAYTAFNMDGGGSSSMYIKEFGPVNDYSDPTERAVANSLFAVSSAPSSDIITSIQPYNPCLYIYPGETVTPFFIAYDQYGNILNKNLQQVVLSGSSSIGTLTGGTFKATATGTDVITAQYNNMSTQIRVTVLDPDQQEEEITVFTDNFNRAGLSPGGNPATNYNITGSGTATPFIEGDLLKLPIVTGENARSQVMGSTAVFSAPFNPVLASTDADSVVWTFNMRHNYNGRLSGIDDASTRGIATILAASSSDLSTADGYAIINGGASPMNYRLVRFTGGITKASNITVLQHGQTLSDNRVYASIKVVFVPGTNSWKLYDRIDFGAVSNGAFEEPLDETLPYSFAGMITDDIHTRTSMGFFGFSHKYSGSLQFNFWTDNFSVRVFQSNKSTGINTIKKNPPYKLIPVEGGIMITTETAEVIIYNMQGITQGVVNVNKQAKININTKGFYLLRIQFPDSASIVEKVLIH